MRKHLLFALAVLVLGSVARAAEPPAAPNNSAVIFFLRDNGTWDSQTQSQWELPAMSAISSTGSMSFVSTSEVFRKTFNPAAADRDTLMQFPELLVASSRTRGLIAPRYVLLARVTQFEKEKYQTLAVDLVDLVTNERFHLGNAEGKDAVQASNRLSEGLKKRMDRIAERDSGKVAGNTESKLYHLPDTDHTNRDKLIPFASEAEARKAGYLPCPICFPEENPVLQETDEDLASLGQNMSELMKFEYPITRSPLLDKEEAAGKKLLEANGLPESLLSFSSIQSEAVFGMGFTGGNIFLSQGMLEIIETDDEAAAVVAHELGHLERNHLLTLYRKAYDEYGPAPILRTERRRAYGDFLIRFHRNLMQHGYPPEMEREADDYAIAYMMKANIKPQAYVQTLKKLEAASSKSVTGKGSWSKLHPINDERMARLTALPAEIEGIQEVARNAASIDPGAGKAIERRSVQLLTSVDAVKRFVKVLSTVDSGPLPADARGEPEDRNLPPRGSENGSAGGL